MAFGDAALLRQRLVLLVHLVDGRLHEHQDVDVLQECLRYAMSSAYATQPCRQDCQTPLRLGHLLGHSSNDEPQAELYHFMIHGDGSM